jgi:diguanylate cyclase (GGDEF)-like protein
MATFLRIDINLIAMFMLFMVFLIAMKRLDQKDLLNRAYLMTLVIVFVQLGIEALTCIINGRDEIHFVIASNVLHVILYSTAPLLTSFWYLLVRQFVTARKKVSQKVLIIIFIPVIANAIISLISPFTSLYFHIDELGTYTRGSWFMLAMIITYAYFIASIIHIFYHRNKLMLNELLLLTIFNLIPIAGAILQSLFYGVLLAWSAAAFSLVIVYIYLQERLVHLDIMTGSWTRRSFDYFMEKRLKQKHVAPFGGIFFDIDHLKMINDAYGHAEGDYAITEIVSRIKGLIKSNEIIARLGGDEFIILSDEPYIERLEELVNDIKLSLSVFNENHSKPYQLSCSYGYGIYSEDFKSIDQFLRYIDHRMYQSKQNGQKKEDDHDL